MKKYLFIGIATLLLTSCELSVLEDPKAFTQDKAQDATGAYLSTAGAIKSGFDAHQRMAWAAGMIGNEEIESVLDNTITQYGLRLERENILAKDNTYNRSIVSVGYQALSLSDNARQAVEKSTFSVKGKALLLANINLIEGIVYGDMAKFYSKVIEFGTGAELDPAAAKTKAITRLQEAITQFKAAAAIPDATPERLTGLVLDPVIGQKLLNSYIGMLYFDTGEKAKAAPFLALGYVQADGGKEVGIVNINTLTGIGVYPEWRNGVEFQLNGYSQKFIDNRITADTLRRAPARWYIRGQNIAIATNRVVANYFFPQSPLSATTPAGGATLAAFPLITWQEVALMQADPAINAAKASDVIEAVLISWRIPAATAKTLSTPGTPAALPLDRVARYEYMGRGRRWSAVGSYPKWEVANEFSFK
ncbi:MAG: hypothetical protein EAZ91_05065 [Cytophagales bacterium]|nr:MAG: hypothetical protein EAZ91_05065 [Cytophagales bacterium]